MAMACHEFTNVEIGREEIGRKLYRRRCEFPPLTITSAPTSSIRNDVNQRDESRDLAHLSS